MTIFGAGLVMSRPFASPEAIAWLEYPSRTCPILTNILTKSPHSVAADRILWLEGAS
jgi:hypothetical protein